MQQIQNKTPAVVIIGAGLEALCVVSRLPPDLLKVQDCLTYASSCDFAKYFKNHIFDLKPPDYL